MRIAAMIRLQATQKYLAAAVCLSLLIIFGLYHRVPAVGTAVDHFIYKGQSSVPSGSIPAGVVPQDATNRIVEMEGLKMGAPFQSREAGVDSDDFMPALLKELHGRYVATLTNPPSYPQCNPDMKRYAVLRKGARSDSSQAISIAINLHNSEAIVPAQSTAILQALAFLQANHQVYVSLFENASDDLTKEVLADSAAALDALGVDGLWMQTSRFQTSGNADRMTMLSEIRNAALRPLMPYAGSGTLIFMNDVAMCPEDILELVYQRQLQGADAVIGTDWITLDDDTTTLYDLWATRGINGELPFFMIGDSGLSPVKTSKDWMWDYWITQTQPTRQRWLDGLPLPIYSGWGGMAAFDSAIFTRDRLRFRSSRTAGWEGGAQSGSMGPWGQLLDSPDYLDGDCPGDSECKLIFRDIWHLREGNAKIVLAPKTRTVYNIGHWAAMIKLEALWSEGSGRDRGEEANPELIDWDQVRGPNSVVCMASRTKDGAAINVWGIDNVRYHINP